MALPKVKVAVYYGTIKLVDGSVVAYTPAEIASLYNVADIPYRSVPLVGPSPFASGREELEYVHLKPQTDPTLYFDAKERYNYYDLEYYDDDFDAHAGGKWAMRPQSPDPDSTD